MTLEKTLLKTIVEYEQLLQSGKASPEEVLRIHQRMKLLRNRLSYQEGSSDLVEGYEIVHPQSEVIRQKHSTYERKNDDPDGILEIHYRWKEKSIDAVYFWAHNFFFPRCDENDEWWHPIKGHHSDFGYNETEFGYMHVLRADGKGTFFSSEVRKLDPDQAQEDSGNDQIYFEKESRRIKLQLWNTMLKDEAIKGFTVSRISLEKGDLTAFFNHIDYHLLDAIYGDND